MLHKAFAADYVVLGGGNAKVLRSRADELPPGLRIGHNRNAFRGAFRVWGLDAAPTHDEHGTVVPAPKAKEWRIA